MLALLDTDVILDLVLDRTPFVAAAEALVEAHEQGRFSAYIAPITPVNVFYIVRKNKGAEIAREAITAIIDGFYVCPLDLTVLQSATVLPLTDFEDAVQLAAALASGLDAIVTRNIVDYAGAPLPVYRPDEFLKLIPHP
ncbi:MAG TPA: PIN domain-containing protein [Herpetosiphonaceae bacterium]|nr:PIN domain-containing protein [Herpetosiphonaceae bacterium]